MKNCVNCGAPMNDADIICQNCGARNVPVQAPKKTGIQLPDFNKIPKKYLGIAAIVAAALIIILVVTIIFSASSSYKSAIDNYFDVTVYGKVEKIEKLAPKEYWEYYEDEYDMDIDEIIENAEDEDIADEIKEEYEDEVGENYKISYKITKEKELSEKKLKALREELNDRYDIPRKSITKAVAVDLDITIKGSEDEMEDEYEDCILVQIDGKWYPTDEYGSLGMSMM